MRQRGCEVYLDDDRGPRRCHRAATAQARYGRAEKTGYQEIEVCDLHASYAQWDGAEITSHDGYVWGQEP